MAIHRGGKSSSASSSSPCAHLRTAYHNCFNRSFFIIWCPKIIFLQFPSFSRQPNRPIVNKNQRVPFFFFCFSFLKTLKPFSFFLNLNRWYSEKFLKGQWDKEECVSEWQKYQSCLSVICFISLEKKNLFFPLLIAISFKLLNF